MENPARKGKDDADENAQPGVAEREKDPQSTHPGKSGIRFRENLPSISRAIESETPLTIINTDISPSNPSQYQVPRRSSWPLAALSQSERHSGEKRISLLEVNDERNPSIDLTPYMRDRSGSISRRISRTENKYRPPDGGWGWVCVAGAFVNYFLVVGLTRSFGVIYRELRDTFPDSTHSQIAAVPSIISTLVIGLTVVAGALSNKFSCKIVAFGGGFLCASSICCCYFTTSLNFLMIAFIFAGIGAALTTTPGILTIALYFQKKRALATSLCLSGTAIGSMVQPPLLQLLSRKFGFRTALLVLGFLMFATCVSAMTFSDPKQQFERHRKKALRDVNLNDQRILSPVSSQSSVFLDQEVVQLPVDTTPLRSVHTPEVQRTSRDEDIPIALQFIAYDIDYVTDIKTNRIDDSLSKLPSDGERREERVDTPLLSESPLTISSVIAQTHASDITEREPTSEMSQLKGMRRKVPLMTDSQEQVSRRAIVAETPDQFFPSTLTSLRESSSSLLLLQFRNHTEARYSILERSPKSKFVLWVKRHLYLDIIFFNNSVFLVVFFSTALMMAVYPTGLIFIPIYSESHGTEETMASLLLSVAAVGDLVGRIICGVTLDKQKISKHYALIVSMLVLAASYLFLIASAEYWYLATCVCVYGISGGFAVLSIPILLADHHGATSLSSTYGLGRIGQAIVGLVTPPIAGYLRDLTDSFMYSFIFMGSSALLGGVIGLFIPLIKHKYRKKVQLLSASLRTEKVNEEE